MGHLASDLEQLAALLANKGLRALLFLTADHGVLWKHRCALESLGDAAGREPARYYTWDPGGRHVVPLSWGGETTHALVYPYTRRPLSRDEAGCHGGLSLEESFVPFCAIEVNP